MVCILVDFFLRTAEKKAFFRKEFFYVVIYFSIMLFETLAIQGSLGEGLRKMFATPALCIFLIMNMKRNVGKIVECMSNIIVIDNVLNLTIFNPYLMHNFGGWNELHIAIGHVQTASQFGLLGMALAAVENVYGNKNKSRALVYLSLLTMLFSETIVSYGILILLLIAYILNKAKKTKWLDKIKSNFIFAGMLIVNCITIFVVIINRYNFGARYFVWVDALAKLSDRYLIGYGVQGVLLTPFWTQWSTNGGFNYAHNEIIQHLLDGGVLLLIAFVVMDIFLIGHIDKAIDRSLRYWFKIVLIGYLMAYISESVSDYNYIYIFMLISTFLPVLEHSMDRKPTELYLSHM